ncbi:hypothetical protein [Phenylobacterium sp.]|uniref:hypothetical protein n=1 Tax=Phenylobacterium sp. TaxID=1871053 RepID=UPI002ED81F70
MTRLLTSTGHSAVHGLAMRTGCRCPDCGRGPRRFEAFDTDGFEDASFDEEAFLADLFNEDADYAARRRQARPARRAPRTPPPPRRVAPSRLPAITGPARRPPARGGRRRKSLPRHRRMTTPQRRAARGMLRSLGWTGWRQGRGGGPVTMQDLVAFSAAGGVVQTRGATQPGRPSDEPRLALTPRGREMLQRDPRYRRLAPMFATGGQRLYHIAEPTAAPDHRSHYVGTTGQSAGLRLLEHLRFPNRDRVHPELVAAARAGTLNRLHVQQGQVTSAAGQVSMTHGAEVVLQNLQRSDWNDPRKHGFEDPFDEALEFDW